jgi:hypothetical protein
MRTGDDLSKRMIPLMLSQYRHGLLAECLAQRTTPVARSAHFALYELDGGPADGVLPNEYVVVHDFSPAQIDNNIGYYVANELLPLLANVHGHRQGNHYRYSPQELFERCVGAIVRSMDGNERRAWHLFYDNTLTALSHSASPGACGSAQDTCPAAAADYPRTHDFIAEFGAIYQQTIHLLAELKRVSCRPYTVLDVAACFGFFPLLLAKITRGKGENNAWHIVACDHNPALVALATDYARQRQFAAVTFRLADIFADDIQQTLPLARRPFDAVTAIHLLEHLDPEQTSVALTQLWQLTGQRLIIAVPLEEKPDARFGHRQVFNRERLLALGQQLGGHYDYFEYHGGWLVIDRPRQNAT